MKKLAFSVWPELPNDRPCPTALLQRAKKRESVLSISGFEFKGVTRCDQDEVAIELAARYTKRNVRKATSISDYTRVAEMIKSLESGYDEVMYLDYDFHIWAPPSNYGVALQCNLQADENGNPAKLWYRGVNAVYYFSQEHLPLLKRHLEALQTYIIKTDFNPTYCYPMNYMAELEETVGYIPGYWILGSVFRSGAFCPEYTEKLIHLAVYAKDVPVGKFIEGINLMGSDYSEESGFSLEQKRAEEIKLKLEEEYPYFTLEDIQKDLSEVRLRPNYNSLQKRAQLKQILGRNK
jgi:hypothetical protein